MLLKIDVKNLGNKNIPKEIFSIIQSYTENVGEYYYRINKFADKLHALTRLVYNLSSFPLLTVFLFSKEYKPYVIGKIISGKKKIKLNESIYWK